MNIILILIGITIILLHTLPLIRAKINLGNIFGIASGLLFAALGIFMQNIKEFAENKSCGFLIYLLLALISVFYIIFIITLTNIIICQMNERPIGDTVIVLGCRVKGSVPTKALLSRCNTAYNYLVENKKAVAVLSGGQGSDENISEAECMKQILVEKGIEASRLYIEYKSTSTYENLKFSYNIIENNSLSKQVIICTNEYHICRALMTAKNMGISATGLSAHSMRFFRVPAFTREVLGIWHLKLQALTKKSRR